MPIALPPPRAVLFDFFGTLTRAVRRGSQHAQIARILGCDPSEFMAELDRTYYARASGRYGPPVEALRRLAVALGSTPTPEALAAAAAARIAAIRADVTLRPDAFATLAALRRLGIATAVVSDCCFELPAFLPTLPIAPMLNACVYSIHVGECKPHPAMYLEACRRLRVDPDQCLYVGDGGSRELTGARDAGMTPVRLAAPDLAQHLVFHFDADFTGAVVGSLAEVATLVDRTLRRGARAARRRRYAYAVVHEGARARGRGGAG